MTDVVAVLDACVLVNSWVRDALLRQALAPALYLLRWSEEIIQEVIRTLRGPAFRIPEAVVDRRIDRLRTAFDEAWISDYESPIPSMCNDAGDRHVLATAVKSGAHAIITYNVKHFPPSALDAWGIECQTPDQFLIHQFHLDPGLVVARLRRQAEVYRMSFLAFLADFQKSAPEFTCLVRRAL